VIVLAGSVPHSGGGMVRWSVDDSGMVHVEATAASGETLLDMMSVVPAQQ
jgi:hypothetical protein